MRSLQLIEQRFRVLQIARVEALAEPGVDRSENVARFGALALIAAQAREARRGAQLIGAGAVLAGDIERTRVTGGGLVGCSTEREEQLTVEPMETGVPPRLAGGGGDREDSGHRGL